MVGDKRKADHLSDFGAEMDAAREKWRVDRAKKNAAHEWTKGEKCHVVFYNCIGQGTQISYVPEVGLDPVVNFLVSEIGHINWSGDKEGDVAQDINGVLTKKKLNCLKEGKEEDKDDDETNADAKEVMKHVADWVASVYIKYKFKPTVPVLHGSHIVITESFE